ncbi:MULTISPECIES: hypothetical protein [Streptomyces]|uniref:hypothetical protein n=1 Tax=Streptomyces TaxID=1883 RepID=UPI00163C591D|nr:MULTISPECIES: hypothetical protein [Streptomyces]MBC2874505.1 hypothetical protein [Streptomyces sp. TYQ1024]UBI36723.1 hypothetical protein K7I03_09780 [Streptomyces mobaraensis]UKW29315.1 hypothetical protein MCU78_09755 [Streptomyces sp. TYQ1024]
MNKTLRTAALLALALTTTATAGVADAATTKGADRPLTSAIRGSGRMEYPVTTEDVRLTVDAHATYAGGPTLPTKSWGTFRLSHKFGTGKQAKIYWGDFTVDCLRTGGPTAVVTGTLTRTSPGHPWRTMFPEHARMGVSFSIAPKGGGPSRIGLAAPSPKGQPMLTKCMASATDARVIAGGYTLRDRTR